MSANLNLNAAEISDIIKEKIEQFSIKPIAANEGRVLRVMDGIVLIHGLMDVQYGERLKFASGAVGIALNLEQDTVGAVILGEYHHLVEAEQVWGTGEILQVPIGTALMGRVVNALGEPIDGKGDIQASEYAAVEKVAPGVIDRKSVDQPLQTGIKAIDSMVPIGRGQRELIIGDRQTGKTAIAIDAILNQKDTGVKCIYVAIGQKLSSVAGLVRKLQ